jgi:FAD:protein FMN transferase
MKYDEFRAMNSDIVLAACGSDQAAIDHGFLVARQFISQSEQRFTRFTETSELAELNRSAGRWYQASSEMFEVLKEAYQLSIDTNGLFNPAVLPTLKRLGYNRSMEMIKSSGSEDNPFEISKGQAVHDQNFRMIKLDPITNSIYLPAGIQVDLGGIAKGWIAEQAAWQLAEYSNSCAVSAGGDMFLVNLPDKEPEWEVGLENPLNPEEDLAILHVHPGAVATSSTAKRQWRHNGKLQHHLIDPRTGEPATTEWLSVTVWAERAAEAEVYAKALLIAGPGQANEIFDYQTSKAYLAVDKTGWVSGSKNYHEVFHV